MNKNIYKLVKKIEKLNKYKIKLKVCKKEKNIKIIKKIQDILIQSLNIKLEKLQINYIKFNKK